MAIIEPNMPRSMPITMSPAYVPASTCAGRSNERNFRLFWSLGMTTARPPLSATTARTEPKSASSRPSIMNGPRMKPLDAPTRRMIAISRRRAEMARRMVLLMNTNAMNARSATSTIAPMRR